MAEIDAGLPSRFDGLSPSPLRLGNIVGLLSMTCESAPGEDSRGRSLIV